jgi:putative redox protein
MQHTVETAWKGKMQFDSEINGHHVMLDALPEAGGSNSGVRPKELLLTSLAGCTAMDVIFMLRKMRHEPEYFNIRVDAEITEEHPKHYTSMHLTYEFGGKDLDLEKLKTAVELSQEKYCGVSYMFKQIMNLSFDIKILDEY